MGSSSVSTHRGLVYWQGFLLVVSLLNFWSQLTTAQVEVESAEAPETMDVILRVHNQPPNVEYFLWYRGRIIDTYNNFAYLLVNPSSRVRGSTSRKARVEDDGSLLLKNVTMEDDGIYTLLVQLKGCQKMIACGRLAVYPFLSAPTLIASNTTVTENKDSVIFTCYTNHKPIQWLFNGVSVPRSKRIKLSRDRRNLTISPVLRRDAGYYQCKVFNPMSSGTSAQLKLDVKFE